MDVIRLGKCDRRHYVRAVLYNSDVDACLGNIECGSLIVVCDLIAKWVVAGVAVLIRCDFQRSVLITGVNQSRRISKHCSWGGERCKRVAWWGVVKGLALNKASFCWCIGIGAQRNYVRFDASRCRSTSNTIFNFINEEACGQVGCRGGKRPVRASCWASRCVSKARTHYLHSEIGGITLLCRTSSTDSLVEFNAKFNH